MTAVVPDDRIADLSRPRTRPASPASPCAERDLDDIVGVVHVKDVFRLPPDERGDAPVASIMTEPFVVPETRDLASLLVDLRQSGSHLAVVVDEYGGTAGIITLEDVVEEIVGDDRRRVRPQRDSAHRDPADGRVRAAGHAAPRRGVRSDGLRHPRGRLRDPGRLHPRPPRAHSRRRRVGSSTTDGGSRSSRWTGSASRSSASWPRSRPTGRPTAGRHGFGSICVGGDPMSALLLGLRDPAVAGQRVLRGRRVRPRRVAPDQARAAGRGGLAPARLALRASHELSLQLAGAQLGITMASLGLGAVAEPAIAHLLESGIELFADLPEGVLHTISFIVALTLVVFAPHGHRRDGAQEHRHHRPRADDAPARHSRTTST